jgi:hypothetical protein
MRPEHLRAGVGLHHQRPVEHVDLVSDSDYAGHQRPVEHVDLVSDSDYAGHSDVVVDLPDSSNGLDDHGPDDHGLPGNAAHDSDDLDAGNADSGADDVADAYADDSDEASGVGVDYDGSGDIGAGGGSDYYSGVGAGDDYDYSGDVDAGAGGDPDDSDADARGGVGHFEHAGGHDASAMSSGPSPGAGPILAPRATAEQGAGHAASIGITDAGTESGALLSIFTGL